MSSGSEKARYERSTNAERCAVIWQLFMIPRRLPNAISTLTSPSLEKGIVIAPSTTYTPPTCRNRFSGLHHLLGRLPLHGMLLSSISKLEAGKA